ncbi:MAG: asparagine synthase (glutamine-hydrolyzing) [Hyphomicrobium sp.]|nr:asparagine synthase (glutamine-hydrolyzing) [Hyphomicrobium sp.]
MCGFAGVIDLFGRRDADRGVIERMGDAIAHRGPDDSGYFSAPGIGIGHRRLSIVGLADGHQPIFNENRTVAVICNGELFDHIEIRTNLEAKGHVFSTHSDSEIIVHLYEEYGEGLLEHLKGQFAFALIDLTKRTVFLARDRAGICPLHWSRQGNSIYFASEIKALLASGEVPVSADLRGLDHMFTFFAMGTRRTMFEGIESLLPGHYLKIALSGSAQPSEVIERQYWDLDFPDAGEEDNPSDPKRLVDEFEATFQRSVELRLRSDVPVVSYLSGGVDSAAVLAMASRVRGQPLPSFTIGFDDPALDETSKAMVAARHIGSSPSIVKTNARAISAVYPKLVAAADCPVVDTSCAALWSLAGEVHNQGYKVALTGEGADEALAGYVWFKINKMQRLLDIGPLRSSRPTSRLFRHMMSEDQSMAELYRIDQMIAGPHAQSEMYSMYANGRSLYYSAGTKEALGRHVAYEDLPLNTERMRRWHPLNQSLYFGYKTLLAGLLLNHKGDRVAMANSVETRYPFLDEDLIKLCARVHPRFKLKGIRQDKYLLRQAASRWLPAEIALRPKAMFRAPFAATFLDNPPAYVQQLMSEESLKRTGYFDVAEVRRQFTNQSHANEGKRRFFAGMSLATVLSTQLWHHLYLGGGLCELPAPDFMARKRSALAAE